MKTSTWTWIVAALAVLLAQGAFSQTSFAVAAQEAPELNRQDVFVGGQDGYHAYRIPALVMTGEGTLLAFCEGRKSSFSDVGDIDLLLKRSADRGRTWSEQMVVYEEGGNALITIGNPCPIVDREGGRVHLLFTRNNKRLFYTRSLDDGLTWAQPTEITKILEGFDYPLVRVGTGPVHGIQMENGRLIAPVWVSDRERPKKNEAPVTNSRFQSGCIYSDDGGETWKTGGLVPPEISQLNECTVLERGDGSLLLNMRGHKAGFRAVSTSQDGETWSDPVLDKNLPCPTCQGSIIGCDQGEAYFLNPAVSWQGGYHPESRRNLTLRRSLDDGRTWTKVSIINAGLGGYSDLALSGDGTVFCLFENGSKRYSDKISMVEVPVERLKALPAARKGTSTSSSR